MKREFILEGLNCPNCGARIEADVGKLPQVTVSSLNLMKQTLTLEVSKDEDIFGKVERIVHSYEPDVKVRLKTQEHTHDHAHEGDTKKMILRMSIGAVIFAASIAMFIIFPFGAVFYTPICVFLAARPIWSVFKKVIEMPEVTVTNQDEFENEGD